MRRVTGRKTRAQLVHLLRGDAAPHLAQKRRQHQQRAAAEREVLDDARRDPSLFRPNRCPVCGRPPEPTDVRFSNPVGFSFAICADDGTVYMDPVPSAATLDRLYNSEGYSFGWVGAPAQASVPPPATPPSHDFAELLRVVVVPPGCRPTLLDVGCATGTFLLEAAAQFDAAGVELNDTTANVARGRGLNVTTGSIADVPGEERLDVITMLQLIEHDPEPATLLEEAHRLLRPGGILYMNTPNVDSASFSLFRERHMHVSSFGHVSLFTAASLTALLQECGFELVMHRYAGTIDIELHDLATKRLAPHRFRHRMALYSPRVVSACELADTISQGRLQRRFIPDGNTSYQIAVGRKPVPG